METYDGVFYSVGLNTKTLTRLPVLALPSRGRAFAPRGASRPKSCLLVPPARAWGMPGARCTRSPLCNKKAQG
jgi:hypothetical protein